MGNSEYLLDGERVTYRSQLHWVLYTKPVLLFIVGVAVSSFALSMIQTSPASAECLKYIGYALMIGSFLWFTAQWIVIQTSKFEVTNKRVIMKTGVFSSNVTELQLRRSESLSYHADFMGNLLGYGTIIVSTGEDKSVYGPIANPEKFRFEINKQIDNLNNSQQQKPAETQTENKE